MDIATPTHSKPRVYRLSPLRRVILDGLALAMLLPPVVILILGGKATWPAIIIFLCFSPTLAILFFCAWYPRIIVGPDGLRFRGAIGFSSQLIPWTNVERLRLKPSGEGVILREPLQTRAAAHWKYWTGVTFMGSKFFDDEEQRYIDEQRYVQIQPFAFWLRHGDLAAQIAHYAPQVAEDYRAHEAAYRQAQSAYNRKIMWVGLISLVIMAATFGFAAYSSNGSPERQAAMRNSEHAFDRIAVWGFSLSLTIYAVMNLRAAASFFTQKHFGYAAFWFLFATIQVLLVFGMWGGRN
jgi:hypothetical protein